MLSLIKSDLRERYRDSTNPVRRDIYKYLLHNNLRYVEIDEKAIPPIVEMIKMSGLYSPTWRGDQYIDSDDDVWEFFRIGCALQYRFWRLISPKYVRHYQYMGYGGADALFKVIKFNWGRFGALNPLDPTLYELKNFFGNIPVKEERARDLKELLSEENRDIHIEYCGDHDHPSDGWYAFGSGGYLERLQAYYCYHDTTRGVRFDKKRQLMLSMIYERLGSDVLWLRDVDEFTIFADYRVPQALRALGVLKYEPRIANMVDHCVPIEKDSIEELEIRLASVVAGDVIVKALLEVDIEADCLKVDHFLWKFGREKAKHTKFHLTYTTAY